MEKNEIKFESSKILLELYGFTYDEYFEEIIDELWFKLIHQDDNPYPITESIFNKYLDFIICSGRIIKLYLKKSGSEVADEL